MTLRIFEVSADGVATPVAKGDDIKGDLRPATAAAPRVTTPPPAAPPERWSGSTEWDRLRARLQGADDVPGWRPGAAPKRG
jgi:hypothetical protein